MRHLMMGLVGAWSLVCVWSGASVKLTGVQRASLRRRFDRCITGRLCLGMMSV